jgi:hypothetical protein
MSDIFLSHLSNRYEAPTEPDSSHVGLSSPKIGLHKMDHLWKDNVKKVLQFILSLSEKK